jgi:hypothetical protein
MAAPLIVYYGQERPPGQVIALTDLVLSYDHKNLTALTMRALAYDREVTIQYRSKYPNVGMLSPEQQADYNMLVGNYFAIANRVKSLGWHPRTAEQDAEYVQAIREAKAAEKGG